MKEHQTNWCITIDPKQALPSDPSSGSGAWKEALTREREIFALSRQKESGVLSIRLLRKQICTVKLGLLNGEAVKVALYGIQNLIYKGYLGKSGF